ncbi:MAG TPA: GAF domain-containing protein [Chloroflexi bacterium]|nr:GAF domain-containing protein [Chloroflexota bacterium]
MREMCLRSLWTAGYNALGVSNGQEALDQIRSDSFDAFVTDLRMPQVSGLDACRVARELDPDLAIIVITGYGTMESAIEALKLGVFEFLLKPFSPDELTDTVERALFKQQLARENARLNALIPLYDLSRVFVSSVDMAVVPRHVVRIARQEVDADSASLMLLNSAGELTIHAAEGLPPEVVANTRRRADEGVAGYVLSTRQPLILQGDVKKDPRFGPFEREIEVASAISVPVIHKDQVLGVLNVAKTREDTPFTEADMELLSVLASQAAVAIENARLFQETQDAYRRLAELDHLKSEFISIAAHELRAPLAILLAYASLIQDEATGSMRDHLTQVVESAMQLKSIIDEMVSLRRIDTGNAQVSLTDVSVVASVETVLRELRPLAERKSLRISTDFSDDLPTVFADEQVFYLILTNLLSNAIKFTSAEGAIHISAYRDGENVVVAVSDTGNGIPQEDLERIFERFYQVEKSLRREHGGIGLGLAIAREMVDLIDGKVWVESQLNRGSTFYISLPCTREGRA